MGQVRPLRGVELALTVYEIGDGEYIYRDSLLVLINQERERADKATLDSEVFKRGYRQALDTIQSEICGGPRIVLDNGGE